MTRDMVDMRESTASARWYEYHGKNGFYRLWLRLVYRYWRWRLERLSRYGTGKHLYKEGNDGNNNDNS